MKTIDVDELFLKLPCLYPTFKEWKLYKTCGWRHEIISVYILPLRNENRSSAVLDPTNLRVYILPLRNENYNNTVSPSLWTRIVYILPLRNENVFQIRSKKDRKVFISYL